MRLFGQILLSIWFLVHVPYLNLTQCERVVDVPNGALQTNSEVL